MADYSLVACVKIGGFSDALFGNEGESRTFM